MRNTMIIITYSIQFRKNKFVKMFVSPILKYMKYYNILYLMIKTKRNRDLAFLIYITAFDHYFQSFILMYYIYGVVYKIIINNKRNNILLLL
jgi:hypothetical protein